jgi:hypothetical protein
MNSNNVEFEDLISKAISTGKKNWRYAWKLNQLSKEKIDSISWDLEVIIDSLDCKKDGHQRELLKLLLKLKIKKNLTTKLWDCCLKIWLNINKQSSVRIKAFEHLVNISIEYPDLKNEIFLLTKNEHIDILSKGIRISTYKKLNSKLKN